MLKVISKLYEPDDKLIHLAKKVGKIDAYLAKEKSPRNAFLRRASQIRDTFYHLYEKSPSERKYGANMVYLKQLGCDICLKVLEMFNGEVVFEKNKKTS